MKVEATILAVIRMEVMMEVMMELGRIDGGGGVGRALCGVHAAYGVCIFWREYKCFGWPIGSKDMCAPFPFSFFFFFFIVC